MALRITHRFSWLAQNLQWVLWLVFVLWLPLELVTVTGLKGVLAGVLWIVLAVGFGLLYGRFGTDLLTTMSTAFYVRSVLETDCTWAQARSLRRLFDDYYGNDWHPSTEVKNLPRSERLSYLLEKAKSLNDEK